MTEAVSIPSDKDLTCPHCSQPAVSIYHGVNEKLTIERAEELGPEGIRALPWHTECTCPAGHRWYVAPNIPLSSEAL